MLAQGNTIAAAPVSRLWALDHQATPSLSFSFLVRGVATELHETSLGRAVLPDADARDSAGGGGRCRPTAGGWPRPRAARCVCARALACRCKGRLAVGASPRVHGAHLRQTADGALTLGHRKKRI